MFWKFTYFDYIFTPVTAYAMTDISVPPSIWVNELIGDPIISDGFNRLVTSDLAEYIIRVLQRQEGQSLSDLSSKLLRCYVFIYVAALRKFRNKKNRACEESTPKGPEYGRYILAWRMLISVTFYIIYSICLHYIYDDSYWFIVLFICQCYYRLHQNIHHSKLWPTYLSSYSLYMRKALIVALWDWCGIGMPWNFFSIIHSAESGFDSDDSELTLFNSVIIWDCSITGLYVN